ncbi:amidohydrolase family protein [Marispirochaeta aestuarii]|uniref:amidohydrolase family protein n=1 Tax=Marispirochaeta aestuarii TaxID=1963862 RepID=UPI0029C60F3B|nr:amidohydrolase family protein [Marispirochaeta aestuarii]
MALRIDSHHHFWNTDNPDYDYYWMSDDLAVIKGQRRPQDLLPWLQAKGIDKTIIVQTIPSLRETEDFLKIAADTDFVAGVVGWVDLTNPEIGNTLEQLKSGPDGKYLVGIRHQVHDEKDARWLLRKDVRHGIKAVGAADLTYDLLLKSRELPAGLEIVQENPGMRFVMDHISKPNIKEGEIEPWAGQMKKMAEYPNVWVKVSGMITEADWYNWKPDDIKPYVDMLLEWYGPSRLMFGSDWPVCTLAGTYSLVYDTAAYCFSGLNPDDLAAVFGGNAVSAYKLNDFHLRT